MPVTGYDIDTRRPVAPSESGRNWSGLARRVVGGGGVGAAAGAALGKYTGAGAGLGAAAGAALGATHGAVKSREHRLSDQTTQERMEMRKALTEYKKQQAKEKKSMIDVTMLSAMQQELLILNKEASMGKEAFPGASTLGRIGTKVVKAGISGTQKLMGRGGRIGSAAKTVGEAGAGAVTKGINRFGAKRVTQGIGAATVGVGALGTAAALGGARSATRGRRRQ